MNSTFCSDPADIHTNACVGTNGWVDAVTYAHGFDIAVRAVCEQVLTNNAPADSAIYPIAFCARHRIELTLKSQIKILSSVTTTARTLYGVDVTKLHDLGALWLLFSRLAEAFDRRYLGEITALNAVIEDFAKIDPTGQTFRYPDDRAGTKHLVETNLINVRRLYRIYIKVDANLKQLEILTDHFCDEYAVGTRTKSLSRRDIEDISNALPARSEWNKRLFGVVRDELISRYGVSGGEFSKALDLIQDHRNFCTNIGMELPLSKLRSEDFSVFCSLKFELDSSRKGPSITVDEQLALLRSGRSPASPSKHSLVCQERLQAWLKSLQDDVFAEIVTVSEASYWLFCERYELNFEHVLASIYGDRIPIENKVIRNLIFLAKLDFGLVILGQTTLRSLIPKICE